MTNNENILITLNKLTKSYKSPDNKTLNVLNIEQQIFNKGETYCIKGKSGSGKTTLLNIVAGILSPDSGSVIINNTDICSLKESEKDKFRAKTIGYIFQNFNLLKGLTALENVILPMQFAKTGSYDTDTAKSLLNKVGLETKHNYKPDQLSFGQQQRVAIARALVNNPSLLLADEPTGSLDKDTSTEIMNLILSLVKEYNITLLIATHDDSIASQMNHKIEL
ncbi:MAG: ABC transporter ATP-binding protein [Vampirovibrionia bacterium]